MSSSPATVHESAASLSPSPTSCTGSKATECGNSKSCALLKGSCTPPHDDGAEEMDSVASSRPSHPVVDADYSLDFGLLHISAHCNPASSSTPIGGGYTSMGHSSSGFTSSFQYTPSSLTPVTLSQYTPTTYHCHEQRFSLSMVDLRNVPKMETGHKTTKSIISKTAHKTTSKSKADRFAAEFYRKGKVRSVMGGRDGIVGQMEAKMMLAYFRNVEVDNIDHQGHVPNASICCVHIEPMEVIQKQSASFCFWFDCGRCTLSVMHCAVYTLCTMHISLYYGMSALSTI